jgi:hypothetical protein
VAADARVLGPVRGVGDHLPVHVDGQGGVDGDHVALAADDLGRVDLVDGEERHLVVAVEPVVERPAAGGERRDRHAVVETLAVRDLARCAGRGPR